MKKYQNVAQGLVAHNVIHLGTFELASGSISPFYINLRPLRSDPKLMHQLARAMVNTATKDLGLQFDFIADVPSAATPLVAGMSQLSGIPMLSPVLERKQRGMNNPVLGLYQSGQAVLLIDDVASGGGSLCHAAAVLRRENLVVTHALVVINRQMGAVHRLKDAHIKLHHLFTAQELLDITRTQKPA